MPPATAAPYFRCPPFAAASRSSSTPVIRDQLLVGRHHALAALECLAHPVARRIQSARQFHDDVHIGSQYRIRILAPLHASREPSPLVLRATLRLKTCVSSSPSGFDSTRMRATELPTVPKPNSAMRNCLARRSVCAIYPLALQKESLLSAIESFKFSSCSRCIDDT